MKLLPSASLEEDLGHHTVPVTGFIKSAAFIGKRIPELLLLVADV
jgi:hypothetical protein